MFNLKKIIIINKEYKEFGETLEWNCIYKNVFTNNNYIRVLEQNNYHS